MRTYLDSIDYIARRMYNSWLGGGHPRADSYSLVAYIYNKNPKEVLEKINKEYEIKKSSVGNKRG